MRLKQVVHELAFGKAALLGCHQFLFEFVTGFEALGHDKGFRIKAGPAERGLD